MRPVGFLRASGIVAAKDLRLEWRTWETLSASLIFALVALVVFSFAFGLGSAAGPEARTLVPGAIWTVLAFASVVGMARSSQLERQHDALGALFLAPVDRGALYAGKALANLVKLAALEIVVVPLAALFFDVDVVTVALPLLAVLLLHGLGLTELGTLFAAVTSRVGRGEALLAVLLLPAATPLLISAVQCTAAVVDARPLGSVATWLLVAAGFDALYLFVSLATFEFVLEE
jgi:heme exporter protein B